MSAHQHASHRPHPVLARLLAANEQWSTAVSKADPGFFEHSAKGQAPKVLWIGCADSRVPASVITAARPGDIFTHRNVANQVPLTDGNTQSVLEYAIKFVGVEHVIVVGHTNCGGAQACLHAARDNNPACTTLPSLPSSAPLNKWLAPVTALATSLWPQLADLPTSEALTKLVEENVRVQVDAVCKTEPVEGAWKDSETQKPVWIHGWVYELESGRLRDLNITRGPPGL